MHLMTFAYAVDKLLEQRLGYPRSQQSLAQKAVCDQMMMDHLAAKSTPEEAATTIHQALKTLESA